MSAHPQEPAAALEAAAHAAALLDDEAITLNAIQAEYNAVSVRAALDPSFSARLSKPPRKHGVCKMEGCSVPLVSRKLKYLWPFPPYSGMEVKNHCGFCRRKVCAEHFTRLPQGKKMCPSCQAHGVEGSLTAQAGREEGDSEDSEEEGEEAGSEAPPPRTPTAAHGTGHASTEVAGAGKAGGAAAQ